MYGERPAGALCSGPSCRSDWRMVLTPGGGAGESAKRRFSRSQAESASNRVVQTSTSRQREDIQRTALLSLLFQIGHHAAPATSRAGIACIEISRHHTACPAADARHHGDVLLAIRCFVRDRLTDDSGACLELPKQCAGARVQRLEPSFHRSVEHDAAGRGEGAAPYREALLHLPHGATGSDIPCGHHAAIAARPCM